VKLTKAQVDAWNDLRQAARELANLTFNTMQHREDTKVDAARATQFMEAVRKFDRADEKLHKETKP